MTPYDYSDELIEELDDKIADFLNNLRLTISTSRTKTLTLIENRVSDTFDEILDEAIDIYNATALHILPSADDKQVNKWLNEYYEVTGYLFYNEYDRKKARLAEEIFTILQSNSIHSAKMLTLMKKYTNYIRTQIDEYAIFIADKALMQSYKEKGVKKVKWNVQGDGKVCSECRAKANKVYDIDKAPPKEHYGCRCYYTEVTE